jgi:predicted SprT family Zn-dependent metalloprotease
MDENLIECLADDLLFEHGLSDWTFEFDRAKVRLGCCHHTDKKITLSRPLCEWADEAEITDTLLHEIAHALCGPGVGHGSAWRRVAVSIGCNGERCHTLDTSENAKYQITCECGQVFSWHRRPKPYSRRCLKCGHSFVTKFDSNGQYVGANDLEAIIYRINN